jgi:hypothetical protein
MTALLSAGGIDTGIFMPCAQVELTGRSKRNMILDDAEAVWHLLLKDERDVLGYE